MIEASPRWHFLDRLVSHPEWEMALFGFGEAPVEFLKLLIGKAWVCQPRKIILPDRGPGQLGSIGGTDFDPVVR